MMNVLSRSMNFAGLFRGWTRRENPVAEKPASAPLAAPAPPPPAAPANLRSPTPAAAPVQPPPPISSQLTGEVEIPLGPILEKLPQDLRARMTMRIEELGNATMAFATEQILPQLAQGTVRITFGQLREAAPQLFNIAEEYDSLPVMLPLNLLLAKLNPNLLPRNPLQRQLQAPPEIKGPFGAKAEGISFATSMMKAPPSSTPPVRMTAPEPMSKIQARAVAPPPPNYARPVAPAPPIIPAPLSPPPAPPAASPTPRTGEIPSAIKFAPASAPIPAAQPKPVAPIMPIAPATTATVTTISAPLSALAEKWPPSLQMEIVQMNLPHAQVLLPMDPIHAALKRGRIVFSWQTLRAWMSPHLSSASLNNGVELDLPLKVIVPLFLEQHPPIRPPLRISIDRSIPDLFFGFPSPEMEAPVAAPIAETPAPEPVQIHRPQPMPPMRLVVQPTTPPLQHMQPAVASDTNYYAANETLKAPAVDQSIYTKPVISDTEVKRRLASPQEIIERAMQIPGVAGAVITLPDGLKVAAKLPAELNSDTVAAFIPQIFERVGQSTRELRMGALNNLRFTVGNVPWKIFRINAVYFAAFGRPGERLPTPQLAQLAAELDHKTK